MASTITLPYWLFARLSVLVAIMVLDHLLLLPVAFMGQSTIGDGANPFGILAIRQAWFDGSVKLSVFMVRRALQGMVIPFPKGATQPWALTNPPLRRFCGVPPRRYVSCQGVAIADETCLDAKQHKKTPNHQTMLVGALD